LNNLFKEKHPKTSEVIHPNHRSTVREAAEEAEISKTMCHEILMKIWACIMLQPNLCRVC
jgi:hypothetical protein